MYNQLTTDAGESRMSYRFTIFESRYFSTIFSHFIISENSLVLGPLGSVIFPTICRIFVLFNHNSIRPYQDVLSSVLSFWFDGMLIVQPKGESVPQRPIELSLFCKRILLLVRKALGQLIAITWCLPSNLTVLAYNNIKLIYYT